MKRIHSFFQSSSSSSSTAQPPPNRIKNSKIQLAEVNHHWKLKITNRNDLIHSIAGEQWGIPSFLRQHQIADVVNLYDAMFRYTNPMIVTKPTGTGKTAEFSALTYAAWKIGLPVIIVVPTVVLVEQTRLKLMEYNRSLDTVYGRHDIAVFCPTNDTIDVGPITIITQDSYVAKANKALLRFPSKKNLQEYLKQNPNQLFSAEVMFHPNLYTLLIVDEGHHANGEGLYSIISRADCDRPKILFSASTLPGEYPKLDKLCHHVITQTLQQAICSQQLAPFQNLVIDFSMYEGAKKVTKSIQSRIKGKRTPGVLDKDAQKQISDLLLKHSGLSLTAVSILKQVKAHIASVQKIMIFTDSIDHANELMKIASIVLGEPVFAYHTKAPDSGRILQEFRNNNTKVIVAVSALDEGFDDPNINLILDFSIYVSRKRRMIQRLGRALRLRSDASGATLISVKLLSDDLQLMPRDEIIGRQDVGFLGLKPEHILEPEKLAFNLPEHIEIELDGGAEHVTQPTAIIQPYGVHIIYPCNREVFKLGMPLELAQNEERPFYDTTTECQFFNSSASTSVVTFKEEFDHDLFDDLDLDIDWSQVEHGFSSSGFW